MTQQNGNPVVAIGMLDDVERKLLHALKAINEDAGT
jgi:hypothetical protein